MKKHNTQLLEETYLDYNGSLDELDYSHIEEFLEALHTEGILDETEQEAYSNLSYTGKCSPDEFEYVKESISLWNEDEYFRRLNIINGN